MIGAVLAVLTAFLLQGAAVASLIAPGSQISPSSLVSQPAQYPQDSMNCGIDEHAIAATFMGTCFFGTKVMDGDSDVGKMIYNFTPVEPVFVYWDVGLIANQFDPGSRVNVTENHHRNRIHGNHFGSKRSLN